MQFPGEGKSPVGIVFDTDLGNGIDDTLALALLYAFEGKNEARVVSVSVSKSNLKAAAFGEVVGRFYSGSVSGAFGRLRRTLPIGLSTHGFTPEDTPMLTVTLSKRSPEGNAIYDHGIHQLNDTAEVSALIRNALTAQHDQSSVVVLAGPATSLVQVLDLPGVKELISTKVRFLSLAAGAYPEGLPEFNIKADLSAARKLLAEWPTPIIASGHEVGEALRFPASSIEKDFDWSTAHPVVDAYRAFQPMPYDAPTWAMAAALYAVRPSAGYFRLSDPGTIRALDDGRTRFTPSPEGRHRYLILDPAQKDQIIKVYTEIASAQPVPSATPSRPLNQQKQQQPPQPPEPKPPAPKPFEK